MRDPSNGSKATAFMFLVLAVIAAVIAPSLLVPALFLILGILALGISSLRRSRGDHRQARPRVR